MNFRQIVSDYFTFSRNERKGIIVLLVLIFLLAVTNKVLFYFETPAKIDASLLDSASYRLGLEIDSLNQSESLKSLFLFNPNTIEKAALDSLNIPETVKDNLMKFRNRGGKIHSKSDFRKIYGVSDQIYNQVAPFLAIDGETRVQNKNASTSILFKFDPNKATDSDFSSLGFSEKQIASFRKYLDKGGVFRSKEDFFKMRVVSENQKKILTEYVVIESNQKSKSKEIPESKTSLLELNSADSISLQQLRGIGKVLSKRIIKYRDLLGGFNSIDQLKEVYGLTEKTINLIQDKVTIDITRIRKLDINFADENELSRHPYLKKNLAKQIVKYRSKNGNIRNLSVLRDSMILNIDEYNRIKPYF